MFANFKSNQSNAKDIAGLVEAIIEFNLDGTVMTANDKVLATLGVSAGGHQRATSPDVLRSGLREQPGISRLLG